MPRRSEVAQLIGIDAVRVLRERLGMKMRVPIGNRWMVAHLAWEGHSLASIARRVRVTDTTARRYLHQAAAR